MQVNTLTKEQKKVLLNLRDDLEKTGSLEIIDEIDDIIVGYSEIDEEIDE